MQGQHDTFSSPLLSIYGEITMVEKLPLGHNGSLVGRLGYGAMGLEGYYGASDDKAAIATLCHAIEHGMMIDTADAYGAGHNESLIAKAVKQTTVPIFLASKFGIVFDEKQQGSSVATNWGFSLNINGTAEYTRQSIDATLQRLDVDILDLWYFHYLDPNTPIEETISAMAEAVQQGKVRHIGLSNVDAETVRKAHAIHPISAVQYEYSLWRREAEIELLPTLRELGIALVAWSPLGSGFLTDTVNQLSENDFRNHNPRFAGNNLQQNKARFAALTAISAELGITPAQLALAWLLHQGQDIFPIPGTRSIARIDENNQAQNITLAAEILEKINDIAQIGLAEGATLL